MLKITLKAGLVGTTEKQRKVVRALGLGKYGSCAFHADSPTIRGMINKVGHLLCVKEAEGQGKNKEAVAPAAAPKKAAAKAK
jgi:large subunit ribosomal protein L30